MHTHPVRTRPHSRTVPIGSRPAPPTLESTDHEQYTVYTYERLKTVYPGVLQYCVIPSNADARSSGHPVHDHFPSFAMLQNKSQSTKVS